MKPYIVSITLLCIFSAAHPQKFWLTTYSFPEGPKTSITLANDSCVFAGTTHSILRSCHDGFSWETSLHSSFIYSLFTTENGRVLAGSSGKIYYFDPQGTTWDSVDLGNDYPITAFLQNSSGELFAITGKLDPEYGYVGAGVLYSSNNGSQWSQRNNGLANYLYCERIAIDSHGRLYLGVGDEYVSGNGGLFISDNQGMLWQHVDIDIPGLGVVDDRIKISNISGLSVSPHDTVYLSLSGVAVNVGVSLNIHKSIHEIADTSKWKVRKVSDVSLWWNDKPLDNIYFASNGDWYSSRRGSVNSGGTFFSVDQGKNWNQQLQGLGYATSGQYDVQFFAENDTGKIYMVQFMDERIYWADTSAVSPPVNKPEAALFPLLLFPNPVEKNQQVYLLSEDTHENYSFTLITIPGNIILQKTFSGSLEFIAPETAGIYLIHLKQGQGKYFTQRLLVR